MKSNQVKSSNTTRDVNFEDNFIQLQDYKSEENLVKYASDDEVQPKVDKCYLALLCLFSSIGGLLFGYNTSVIGGAKLYLDDSFENITDHDTEIIVSSTLAGAAVGSLFGGPIADKYGRKPTILFADIFFTVGCLIMGFTPSILILVLGSIIVGLGVGSAAIVVPVYIAEVAPKSIRGTLVSMKVVCITFGQVFALFICLALGDKWRWMLGLAAVPSVIQAVGILFMIESPTWLFKVGKHTEAIHAITRLYNGDESQLKPIIQEQKQEADNVREYEYIGMTQLLKQIFTRYRPCLIVGCAIQMFQQLTGINTTMYYGPEIMKQAGFGSDKNKTMTLVSAIPLAVLNMIGTIMSLAFIDNCGRRWILLRTIPLIILSLIIISIGMGIRNHTSDDEEMLQVIGKWLAASGLSFYMLSFSLGLGSTSWVINSEIYPLHLRGLGNSLAAACNWIANFMIAFTFLTLMGHIPYGDIISFIIMSVFCVLAFTFVYFKIPETKGLRLDEVISLFVKDHNKNDSLLHKK